MMTPRGRNAAPPVETNASTGGLQISARLASNRILPIEQDQHLVITVRAPDATQVARSRPPVALAIVIDRSGSMHGEPIRNAKAAALSVLRQLGPSDAFTVVTYSSASEVVLPIQVASEANKAAARAAIETIDDDGGTCISCGLDSAAAEVARAPIRDGVQRLLVISDGQANEGVYDRDELAAVAASHAAHGTSISTVGVGLDFDERTMRRLAEVGRGNYYFVEDTVALSTMFAQELEALGAVIAADVRVGVTPSPGVRVVEAYGYPMTRSGDGVVVPIADLRAGETRKLVLHLHVAAPASDAFELARIDASWRDVALATRGNATAAATAQLERDPDAIAAATDPVTVQAIEEALSARALDEAAAAYDKEGVTGAQRVLQRRVHDVRAKAKYLPKPALEKLESAADDASGAFATAPAKAKKAASVNAYKLAR